MIWHKNKVILNKNIIGTVVSCSFLCAVGKHSATYKGINLEMVQ